MSRTKLSRSEQARLNGARSRGPKTLEGRLRIARANRKHGLYAKSSTLLNIESREAFEHLRQAALNLWTPRNPYEAQYVEELADCCWRIARLRLAATNELNVSIERLCQAAESRIPWENAVSKSEAEGSAAHGAQTLIQRRVSSLIANRSKITLDLLRLKTLSFSGITQDPLQTRELPSGSCMGHIGDNQPENGHNQTSPEITQTPEDAR